MAVSDSSPTAPRATIVRETGHARTAVLFVHGFGGKEGLPGVAGTWGDFPTLLTKRDPLADWDVLDLGYGTSLRPDVRGIWSADAGIDMLAGQFRTRLELPPLDRYQRVAIVAHSMGGLVVQRALLDGDTAARASHVFLFGTPSAGMKRGRFFRWFKKPVEDMLHDGPFITRLRREWYERFGADHPFSFFAVAGDRDEFVPPWSSVEPFSPEDRYVVFGNHVELVKPAAPDDLSLSLVERGIVGEAYAAGPMNAARVALERGRFQEVVDRLQPHAEDLDEQYLGMLALAVESLHGTERALHLLRDVGSGGLDMQGILAGRLKRRWMLEGREADATEAHRLYASGFEAAEEAGDAYQARYHGINLAFMLAARGQPDAAREVASRVLALSSASSRDPWELATRGEALLHADRVDEAVSAYAAAVEASPEPWQVRSMATQTTALCDVLRLDEAADRIAAVFEGGS